MQQISKAQDFAESLRKKPVQTGALDELKVDPHFHEDHTAAKVVEYCVKRGKNLLLVGPTGCGKSGLAVNVMARLKRRAEIFSCTGETSTDELIAKPWIVESNGQTITEVAYGAALRSYKEGTGLLLEEVDMANPDILAALHRIMELNSGHFVCNVGRQEIVQRHKDFFVIATANTIGTGEDTFMYAGTKPLNQAFMNRFSFTYRLGYLTQDEEIKVVCNKTGVEKRLAQMMVNAANDVRDANDPSRTGAAPGSASLASVISTRDLLEWADAIVGMGMDPRPAAEIAFLNRINETDRDSVRTFITNRVP